MTLRRCCGKRPKKSLLPHYLFLLVVSKRAKASASNHSFYTNICILPIMAELAFSMISMISYKNPVYPHKKCYYNYYLLIFSNLSKNMPKHTQLAIIGAGPGGYTAAFHAADLGLSVTLIDKKANPGGTCLYEGCIPSKALLHAARIITESHEARNIGITFSEPQLNIDKLRTWKETVIRKLTGGLGQLTKARKISYIQGEAKFTGSNSMNIVMTDGSTDKLTFDKAILAIGSSPIQLPGLPKSPRIWDSTDALALPLIPETMLVIGGGYIGLELGSAYAALGTKVSIVEALPQLLGGVDQDLAEILLRRLKRTFAKILTGTRVISAAETPGGILIAFQDTEGKTFSETYSQVLSSIGRQPNTRGLGIEHTQITLNTQNFIEVNSTRQTTDPHIYAIGDITGQPMLAHKASSEAKVAVQAIAGRKATFTPKAIPAVIFTNPELAWAGLTEAEAKQKNIAVTVFKFPWGASGRALTLDRTDGITKVIADTQTKCILGVGIVGINAGDLIAEGSLAIETKMTAEALAHTIHPHPTLSETLMETAEGLFGNCIHLLRKYDE